MRSFFKKHKDILCANNKQRLLLVVHACTPSRKHARHPPLFFFHHGTLYAVCVHRRAIKQGTWHLTVNHHT